MDARFKQTSLQKRHSDGQEAQETMFNFTNYQRKANQDYKELSPYTSQNGHHQNEPTNSTCWRRVERREPSCTTGGNVNWYSHCGEQHGGSLKTNKRTTIWPSKATTGHIPWENYNSKRCTPMLTAALFSIARTWKQLKCPTADEGRCGIYEQQNIIPS